MSDYPQKPPPARIHYDICGPHPAGPNFRFVTRLARALMWGWIVGFVVSMGVLFVAGLIAYYG